MYAILSEETYGISQYTNFTFTQCNWNKLVILCFILISDTNRMNQWMMEHLMKENILTKSAPKFQHLYKKNHALTSQC